MGPVEAIKTCLQKSFRFSGRASRAEYWWFMTFLFGSEMIANVIDARVLGLKPTGGPIHPVSAMSLWLALSILPDLAVGARRFQDTGISGWVYFPLTLITYAPFAFAAPVASMAGIAAAVVTTLLLIRRSQPGPNRYGPNPLEVTP